MTNEQRKILISEILSGDATRAADAAYKRMAAKLVELMSQAQGA